MNTHNLKCIKSFDEAYCSVRRTVAIGIQPESGERTGDQILDHVINVVGAVSDHHERKLVAAWYFE